MANRFELRNNIVLLFLIFFMLFFCFSPETAKTFYSIYVDGMIQTLCGEENAVNNANVVNFAGHNYSNAFFMDLSGYLAKVLKMNAIHNDENIYVADDMYITSKVNKTSTDYEYEQVLQLKEGLEEKGIHFLYVNAPTKYSDDSYMMDHFGVRSYANQNADVLMKRLSDAGVDVVDLRTYMKEDGLGERDLFYRTDHHWNTTSGLWASKIISQNLNDRFGYAINMDLYNQDLYEYSLLEKSWLGEQGRKMGKSYVGMDDYIITTPVYEGSYYMMNNNNEETEGDFLTTFVNYKLYNQEGSAYDQFSYHYSYMYDAWDNSYMYNANVEDGNVLILGDSYGIVVAPFLINGVNSINYLNLRSCPILDLPGAAESLGVDTVIVLYSEIMIGAHDDETNDNYGIFEFNLENRGS